jgi:hypothetical protein
MSTPSKEGDNPCSNENSEESESEPDMDEVLLAEFEENEPSTAQKQGIVAVFLQILSVVD